MAQCAPKPEIHLGVLLVAPCAELGHARQLQPSAEVVHASAKLVKLRERVLALGLKSTELEVSLLAGRTPRAPYCACFGVC